MNRGNQTAYEIGREYEEKLQELVSSYELLSGKEVRADDYNFWDSVEVNKIEILLAFWWSIDRFNDPFYFDDSFIEEQEDEEN